MTSGNYKGRHYTEWVEEVKELKRSGDTAAAEELLHHLVDAVEAESKAQQFRPAPWYYEQLAILARKRKDYDAEVAILERYDALAAQYGDDVGFSERLRKARGLAAGPTTPEASPTCPTCGMSLDALPKQRGQCPNCGEKLIVRRRAGRSVLLTESGDAAQKQEREIAKAHEQALKRANRIGISDADFVAVERELTARGPGFRSNDVFWSAANRRLLELAQGGDDTQLANVYREMASVLAEEHRPWMEMARQAVDAELRFIGRFTAPNARLATGGCRCDACAPGPELIFSVAIKSPPIPHADCDEPPCRCRLYERYGDAEPANSETGGGAPQEPTGFFRRVFGR